MDDHDQHPSQDVHAKSSTMAQTNAAADLARAGSTARSNAIAKLRRAASQRELRKGPVTALAGASSEFRSGSAAGNYSHIGDGVDIRSGVETPTDEPLPHDTASIPQSTDDSHSEQAMSREPSRSPLAPPLSSLDAQIGIRSPYSRLARSPLPSLEELRARIKEREAHGLSRSASASAASQAARAFAMNKLLGGSNRGTGAQSPSSDFLGNRTPSPLPDSVAGAAWERDGRSLKERAALRRSRTVGGLSAMAEAQRRAAFGGNGESSAQGAEGQYGDGPSELPPRANTAMSHTDSKRQAARTEMMRKLSGRGRGAKSPRNLPPGESAVSAEKPFTSPLTLGLVPPTPGNADVIRTATSPALSVRTFASSRRLRRRSSASSIPASTISAYSYAPSTHTGRHTMERDRDSALAKLVGEDSFQYEQLLSMGYSSEAAYSTVMSSPSVQSFRSRRNEPPDFEGPMPDREEGAATPDLGQVHTQWQAVDGIGLEVGTQTPETDEGFDSFKAWTEAQRRASIQARLEQRELQLEGEQEQREQDVRNQSDSITPNGYDQHYPLESPDGEQENGLEAIPIAMNPIPAANASTVSFPLTVSAHTSQLAAQSSTSLATSTTSSVEGQSDAHSIQTAQGAAPRLSFQTQGKYCYAYMRNVCADAELGSLVYLLFLQAHL